MTGSFYTRHLLAIVSLSSAALASSNNLPYNPTRIFVPSKQNGGSYAYVIQPGSDSTTSAQFSSIDLTQSLGASSLSLNTLSLNLPFLSSSSSNAYTPLLDSSGNITVLVGDCTKGAGGVGLWRFQPSSKAEHGQGKWTQDEVSKSLVTSNTAAANYLNGGIAFSEIVNSNATNTDMYVFGGMCPTTGASQSTWQTAASYSNLMMTLTPESAPASDIDYQLALLTSSGPPIAEAGFSITGLSPTFSNASGIETQQQSFVLLGGHTQQAFINMSQVALFSLPQGAWSYLPITQSSSGASTVTPRSGHTAVLSEDGRSVVVYGGWVGDVNTPATPQLAILEIGTGYGGIGNWYWSTPSTSGDNAPSSNGIYGHGAVMLPGNIMMIMGGYTISSAPAPSRLARRATSTTNTQALFYNVTSGSWLSSYTPPESDSSNNMLQDSRGGLTTTAQKAGLGVGLTIAIVLVVGLVIFCFMYYHRRRSQHRGGDGHVLMSEKLSFDEAWRHTDDTEGHDEMPTGHQEEVNNGKEAFPWLPEIAASAGWKRQHANNRDGGSTGAFVNIPSPTRGLRKGSIARSTYQYQAAPDGRASLASVGIHPIEEQDEEGSMSGPARPGTADAERRLRAIHEIFRSDAGAARNTHPDDPFKDPELNPLGSHPVSPDPEYNVRRAPTNSSVTPSAFGNKSVSVGTDQITTWVNQWSGKHVQQEMHSYNGRVSPSKSIDDRTSSTLSEQSNRSDLSARSIARTTSTRSHAVFGLAGVPRISPLHSPTEEKGPPLFGAGRVSPSRDVNRNRSVTAPMNQLKRQGDGSVPTFSQLREEADALLGAEATNSGRRRPLHRRTSSSYSQDTAVMPIPSGALPPSTSIGQARRNPGWMGSIRRVLSGSVHDRSATPPIDTFPLSGNTQPAYVPYRDRSASPNKRNSTAPRRTASDGSTFLRTKRGQEDWSADSEGNAWEPYRDEPDTGDWGAAPDSPPSPQVQPKKPEADVDWDIERAAATRDVQVMFTMPKARLRVVNPDDDKSTRSVSEGGLSRRSNSNKSRHEKETSEKSRA